MSFSQKELKHVLNKYENYLRNLPGVTGTGIGLFPHPTYDRVGIIVLLTSSNYIKSIPKELDGIPVHVEVSGPLYAH